jgi:2-oxoglutarate dehydrogenase E1 component
VLLCSGKIYHELAEVRRPDVALVRVEQLYPLADESLAGALAPYADGTPVVWVQEEPENMGAWWYMRARFGERILGRWPLTAVCRPASASPATGSASSHKLEQKQLLERAYAG